VRAVNEEWRFLCEQDLSQTQVAALARAVEEDYFFEFFFDDLPIWGYIGDASEEDTLMADARGIDRRTYVFKHFHFSIAYNGKHVVGVNVTADPISRELLTPHDPKGQKIAFSYSVDWSLSDTRWEDRMKVYEQYHFLPDAPEVHWLAITNSLVLVVLLTACLAIIVMRIVHHDFALSEDPEAGDAREEDIGWKLISRDVFRLPSNLSLLTALVGAGSHLFATVAVVLLLVGTGMVHPSRRGAILSTLIFSYTMTAGIGGFVSARLWRKLSGDKGGPWAWNIVMSRECCRGSP
jgi:transmembrane 9 superfamily member 3